MDLRKEDIQSTKTVGELDGKPVIEVITTGGFHLLVSSKGQGMETLGTGPHKCVSRHIAQKRYPHMKLTELSKSDFLEPMYYEHLLPKWESFTDTCNSLMRK